jgi:hypothetical protein
VVGPTVSELREREWEVLWRRWSPEQREYSVKLARNSRNFKLLLSSGVTIWNGLFGGANLHSSSLSILVMWCLGCMVASICWEGGWQAQDFLSWSRNRD